MNILLVGFTGHENSSKLLLDLTIPKYYLDKLYLDSRTERAKKELIAHMEQKKYGYVLIVSMKEDLQEDQLEFVIRAAKEKDMLETNFIYEDLRECLSGQERTITIRKEPAEGLAGELYYAGLEYIQDKGQETRCLLMNLPATTQIDVMDLSKQIIKYFGVAVKAK